MPIYNDTYVMLFFGMLKKMVAKWLVSDPNQVGMRRGKEGGEGGRERGREGGEGERKGEREGGEGEREGGRGGREEGREGRREGGEGRGGRVPKRETVPLKIREYSEASDNGHSKPL